MIIDKSHRELEGLNYGFPFLPSSKFYEDDLKNKQKKIIKMLRCTLKYLIGVKRILEFIFYWDKIPLYFFNKYEISCNLYLLNFVKFI